MRNHTRFSAAAVVMAALLTVTGALADAPAGYYDTVDTTDDETLRATLHLVIDGHTKIPYTASSTDTWNVLELADEDPYNSGRILDLYQNNTFTKYGAGNTDYNREHTWPKSYGFPDDGSSNKPYSDCHHLFLCDIGYNGDRDSNIFDDCESGCTSRSTLYYDGQSGVNYIGSASPIDIWETWDGRKGDVARACFYMDVRYEGGSEIDLILTDDPALILSCQTGNNEAIGYMGLLTTLLAWHAADPVDDRERDRNDVVHTYQGNRNPFIDHPEWVAAIFDPTSAVDDAVPGARTGIARIHPNPFNPSTTIACTLAEPGDVTVRIYGLDGRLVRTLTRGYRQAGDFDLQWNGTDELGRTVASGQYFCRLHSGDRSDTQKVLMLK